MGTGAMKKVRKIPAVKDSVSDYGKWIADLKRRYRATQIKAAVAVNSALIEFYWNLGKDISEKFAAEAEYGSRFFERVSLDMREDFPNDSGFSPRNIRYCRDFYTTYLGDRILQQVVAKSCSRKETVRKMPQVAAECYLQQVAEDKNLQQHVADLVRVPWGHHINIIHKCKGDREKALFYVRRTIQNGWSRSSLLNWLSTDLYEREGKAQTNYALTMGITDYEVKKVLPTQAQLAKCYADAEARCAGAKTVNAEEALPRNAKKGKVAK